MDYTYLNTGQPSAAAGFDTMSAAAAAAASAADSFYAAAASDSGCNPYSRCYGISRYHHQISGSGSSNTCGGNINGSGGGIDNAITNSGDASAMANSASPPTTTESSRTSSSTAAAAAAAAAAAVAADHRASAMFLNSEY